MESGKRHLTEGVKPPNQAVNKTLGENDTYKHFGILEAGTIKQVEMKEKKLQNSISEEQENYSRQNSIAGTLLKGNIPWLSPS